MHSEGYCSWVCVSYPVPLPTHPPPSAHLYMSYQAQQLHPSPLLTHTAPLPTYSPPSAPLYPSHQAQQLHPSPLPTHYVWKSRRGFNPRRACAARVTVVGSVCVSVSKISLIVPQTIRLT